MLASTHSGVKLVSPERGSNLNKTQKLAVDIIEPSDRTGGGNTIYMGNVGYCSEVCKKKWGSRCDHGGRCDWAGVEERPQPTIGNGPRFSHP